jgi:hypothetical protein
MIPMRDLPLIAAVGLAGALAACASPGPVPPPAAPPPPRLAVETVIEIARDGAPFASFERTLWRQRDNRFELEGPEVLAGDVGHGLELSLRPDFNHAGEFWGELTAAEFEVLEDGTRVHLLGAPRVFRLDPTVTRTWTVELPGRADVYAIRIEMDYDFTMKSELLRRD